MKFRVLFHGWCGNRKGSILELSSDFCTYICVSPLTCLFRLFLHFSFLSCIFLHFHTFVSISNTKKAFERHSLHNIAKMSTTTRHHIVPEPKFVLVFRFIQLVVAVIVLGLASYGLTFLVFDGIGITLFSAIASIIITLYVIISTLALPIAYNYWAILGLDIFAIVFWLISFALLGSEIASFDAYVYDYTCDYLYCYEKRDLVGMELGKRATTSAYTYYNAMVTASVLGGLEFILFIVTLVTFGIFMHRHRASGAHCMPGAGISTMGNAQKVHEMQPQNGVNNGRYGYMGGQAVLREEQMSAA
jgi:hypothetical protein